MHSIAKRTVYVELGERLFVGGQMYEIVRVPSPDPLGNIVLWLAIGRGQPAIFTMHVHPMHIMEVFHPLM